MGSRRKVVVVFFLIVTTLFSMGLSECYEETAPVDTKSILLDNSLAEGYVEIPHYINGEDFVFVTRYSTDYDINEWRLTDNKTLLMRAWIESNKPVSETAEVFIEHVHIDCSIQALDPTVDGLSQDSMDDKLHTSDQIGFWISEYDYENYFAIEGTSETMMNGWGFIAGGYGSYNMQEERLTEQVLVKEGKAYGSKLQFVYDLQIRNPGEKYYHTRAVKDELMIHVPNAEEILENAGVTEGVEN